MPNEMVERVAQAMRAHDCAAEMEKTGTRIPPWDEIGNEETKAAYRSVAGAAILAMREPTEAMIRRAESDGISADDASQVWADMAAEALGQ